MSSLALLNLSKLLHIPTIAMVDQRSLKAIKHNPIGKGLDGFRASFNVMCEGASIFCSPDALELLTQEGNIVGSASL
jgi:hypothetical protein